MSEALTRQSSIGVIGAGTMGSGIAQVAASAGHRVFLYDTNPQMLDTAEVRVRHNIKHLVEKGKLEGGVGERILSNILTVSGISELSDSALVIEAVVEDLNVKREVFKSLASCVRENCLLASNTSSLSITSLAPASRRPSQFLGIHFFNPVPLMPLVEIIPGVETDPAWIPKVRQMLSDWGKITVAAKDTPGFIVNRIARPFYGEALRISEESIATPGEIDAAMREIGGFKMGPFELMDLIGNDVNFAVTESVFKAFFFDPRYRPSLIQQRMVEAGRLGKKTGRGYYNYSENTPRPSCTDRRTGQAIVDRILAMLINEAADAVFLGIAVKEDIELAMTRGVNYPKGLLHWADELGIERVVSLLARLQDEYGEDRYRTTPLLKRMARERLTFFPGPANAA